MTEIIEGMNPVIEALKAGRSISRILLCRDEKSPGSKSDILRLSRDRAIPVEYVERHIIDKQSSTRANQGIIAYTSTRQYLKLDDLLSISAEKGESPLYCVLDGIEDPHNLGAILRTAEATAVQGVVVRSNRAVGITPAVAKASAGAVEYIPVARVANISQALETLKKNNIWIIGIDMNSALEYSKVDFTLPTAIVIGAEGKGLSALVKKRCDFLSYIPMKGRIASLNASVAAAIVMYEALKQRSR